MAAAYFVCFTGIDLIESVRVVFSGLANFVYIYVRIDKPINNNNSLACSQSVQPHYNSTVEHVNRCRSRYSKIQIQYIHAMASYVVA